MNKYTEKLEAGINLHVIKESKFKTSIICILIRQELRRDKSTITALIPPILQNGSQKYTKPSMVSAAVEQMYGAVFDIQVMKKGEEQILQFYLEFANGYGIENEALEFLREMMLNPLVENNAFNSECVNLEKQNLITAIEGRINFKAEYSRLRCLELMCAEEPFGVYGDGYSEDLKGDTFNCGGAIEINGSTVYEHYIKLLRESPIEFIILCGGENTHHAGLECDHENYSVHDFYSKHIKSLFIEELNELGRAANYIPTAAYQLDHVTERRINEKMNITQGKLCMGFRANINPAADEFMDLVVFNELLGGMADSRLFNDIREKRGLCYYINSFVYRFKSILFIQSGVDSDKFEMVIDLIKLNVESLKKLGAISDAELSKAKKSLISKYRNLSDSQSAIIEFLFAGHILDNKYGIDDYINHIAAVQQSSLQKIADRMRLDTIYTLGANAVCL